MNKILWQITFGNGTTQTFGLNDRFQMTDQQLKKGSDVLQKYAYGYGQIDGSGNLDTAKNNGQLAQVDSWIGTTKQWTQKFTNDHIGRLKQTEERRGDTNALSYKQTFDFDRFGNMYRKAASNPTTGQENPLPYTAIEDGDVSKSTNRFTTDTAYDDAGNVIVDEKFRSMSFAYDANGRMVNATRPSVPDAVSVYDASGLRVAEKVNDIWRFMIYDVGGKLIAEYGGLQSTDEGGVKYVLQDWQGSTRAVVGNTGSVQSRTDFTSFGEPIQSGGLRSSSQGFGKSSSVRQGYALTEKDDATGLDHTWFRKNENQAGRWTSPDPYNGSMSPGDPQSFNRYSYVGGQPTNFVDPTGLNDEPPITIETWEPRHVYWRIPEYWFRSSFTGHTRDPGIGGTGGSRSPKSAPGTGPCTGTTPTYTQERRDHIWNRHGNPTGTEGSLYLLSLRDQAAQSLYNAFAGMFGWEQLTYRDVFEAKIQRRNQFTVNSATAIPSGNSFVYVSAEYYKRPPDIEGEVVGVDAKGPNAPLLQYTNVNTVVVNSDCAVITSHPGMPTRPNLSARDSRIFGRPTWWNLAQFRYIW